MQLKEENKNCNRKKQTGVKSRGFAYKVFLHIHMQVYLYLILKVCWYLIDIHIVYVYSKIFAAYLLSLTIYADHKRVLSWYFQLQFIKKKNFNNLYWKYIHTCLLSRKVIFSIYLYPKYYYYCLYIYIAWKSIQSDS